MGMEEWCSEPEPNVIESSTGFSVRVLGRTGLRYMEGHRSVWIDSEVLAKPAAIALFKDSIKRWEGDSAGQVSEADRDRIASNIKRAFEFSGYELEVHTDFDWRGSSSRGSGSSHAPTGVV
jgi:hypothetical protein